MKITTVTVAVLLIAGAGSAPATAQSAPEAPPRTVTLPLTEYNRLIDLSTRAGTAPVPPRSAILATAHLRVRADQGLVRGTFELAGRVLVDGMSRVDLVSDATLLSATSAGRPLPLVTDGQMHAALLPGPGPFTAALEWSTPIASLPGRASFTLPVPAAGAARATIDVPGEGADVQLTGGLITARNSAAGRTVVEATVEPGARASVSWSMRESAPVAAARETRTLADVLTLITLGESDIRLTTLVDITVVQGEPRTFDLRLPGGYELASVAGSSVETSDARGDRLVVTVADPAARRHQFLVSLEREHGGGSLALDTPLLSVAEVLRERGDVAVEAVGTLELDTTDRAGLQRIDVRELNPTLRSLARQPILTAFRYHRATADPPTVALGVRRFGDAGVLAASIDHAQATTLVTVEGRALTELVLQVRNRAQPFLKVDLPDGASIVSVEVGGQPAKPVSGVDGTRVPLLRNGFRPASAYRVSFVYLHAGVPFASKGDLEMALPRLDVPIGLLEWELFAPDAYTMRTIGGNAIDRAVVERALRRRAAALAKAPTPAGTSRGSGIAVGGGTGGGSFVGRSSAGLGARPNARVSLDASGGAGLIAGRVVDTTGAVLAGVQLTLEVNGQRSTTVTDGGGTFRFFDVPEGETALLATRSGFGPQTARFRFDRRARQVEFTLAMGALEETMVIAPAGPVVDTDVPSANVLNLQRRAAGVLPIRVDVPRAGASYRYVKPLVVDQETTVVMRYRKK